MNKFCKLLLILSVGFSNLLCRGPEPCMKTRWIDTLNGDFDFRTKWSYPEGVSRNEFGQLSCAGFCPEGTESMFGNDGKIHPDSLPKFYRLVDTTHQFHSISCEAWCYEWAGTDFITAKQTDTNQVLCSTMTSAGTHCSLILKIRGGTCVPSIEIKSISAPGVKTYYCGNGFITIERNSWTKGILKADFNFTFNNTDEPGRNMFWKGKIYTAIEKQ